MIINDFDTDQRVFIVAEIGNNHEGDFDTASRMIHAAAECGADAVKFQTFIPEYYVSSVTDAPRVEKLRKFQLSFSQFESLKAIADDLGVVFFSTPFDLESAMFLNEIQPLFKISSGDNNFEALIRMVAGFGKNMIVSTGMCDEQDLDQIHEMVTGVWKSNGASASLALLHCVSSYPVPPEQANISVVSALKSKFPDTVIGYSDHVIGNEACLGAVALGARMIEKHFTLDRNFSDFRDHQLSADPEEFGNLCRAIRKIEALLGDGIKSVQPSEHDIAIAARRSIAARKHLDAGTIIEIDDLTWVRPGTGIACGGESAIVGKKLARNLEQGELFQTGDVTDP
jgi:N,N'-diacetyllegionaminate synthase